MIELSPEYWNRFIDNLAKLNRLEWVWVWLNQIKITWMQMYITTIVRSEMQLSVKCNQVLYQSWISHTMIKYFIDKLNVRCTLLLRCTSQYQILLQNILSIDFNIQYTLLSRFTYPYHSISTIHQNCKFFKRCSN